MNKRFDFLQLTSLLSVASENFISKFQTKSYLFSINYYSIKRNNNNNRLDCTQIVRIRY